MKKHMAFLLSVLLIISTVVPVSVYGDDNTNSNTLKIGMYYTGDGDDKGDPVFNHGYDYEYLQALSQYTGWEYEYVKGSWEQCLDWLKDGKIDMMGFVQKTSESEEIYGFPKLPMATTSGYLVAASNGKIDENDLKSPEVLNIGIVKSNGYNNDFKEYVSKHGYNVNYVEYDSLDEISPALKKGDIDAAVVAEEDKTSSEHIIMKITSYDQYFATDIDNKQLLNELDEAMQQVNTYCPDLNNDLKKKYFQSVDNGKPVFTQAEQKFINENKNILVLYDSGWPPVEYLDEKTNKYKGISPDIFALLTQKCGINFVYEGSTSGQVLSELKNGKKENILTTISYDYAWADQHDVLITQPFVTSNIVKLGKNIDAKKPVVAINKDAYFSYLLKDELKGKKTQNYAKQAERLEAVRKGDADYTFVTEDQANYYRSIPKYSSLDMERMVGYEQQICISIEKNSDPALMSIISKSLASITHDEITNIITKNTVNAYHLTFLDKVRKYHAMVIILALPIAVIILILTWLAAYRRKNMEKLKKAYDDKEEALLAAQKASVAKGNFMSRMSHEIRTPLNAVIGYNTIARNAMSEAKDDNQRKHAEMKAMDCMTKSDIASKHLLAIINDVLDMSAIESGKIKVAHDRFDFKGLITSLTTIFYSQARSKGVDFEVVFDTATEEWFVGDQMRTNQILTNLISNAIKFTGENGTVKLSIRQFDEDNKSATIQFEVADTGIGMTKEYLTHLWTPFEQADSSISRRFGGTGLGLSICKNLVDIMGGTIDVSSKPGEGTSFIVTLKYDKTEQSDKTDVYDFNGINALIVDDDPSTCDYIRLLFNRCGARCATVTSGADAIKTFHQAEKRDDAFNLCLVDWQMPKMDGIETIKRIREIAGEDIPIIVITAYDFAELADRAAEVGVNMFVSKPLFQSSLFDMLVNIGNQEQDNSVKKSKKYDFNGAPVLLAEDNSMNMEIAKNILESANLTVETAWNGQEAVDMLQKSDKGHYKVILMDVQMPLLDGNQATKEIRSSSHPDGSNIPIIAMTADAFAENIEESYEAGMNDYISKPIDLVKLFDTLSKYIGEQ